MTERRAKLKRILILAGIVVVLALPLMFLLEDFVGDAIIAPTAYVIWLSSVIVDALPGSYLLGFTIAVISIIGIRSLFREDTAPPRRRTSPIPSEGAAAAWLRRLQLVTKGTYSEQRLEQQVGQLMLRVIAYENRCSLREANRLIENRLVDLPPNLADYLQEALKRQPPQTLGFLGRLKRLLPRPPRSKPTAYITRELAPVLTYLENELKIRPPEETNE